MDPIPGIEVFGEIEDDEGNRLTLRFVELKTPGEITIPGLPEAHKAYAFHSLVWDKNDGSTWKRIATITGKDLAFDGTRRWVSEIHSLVPDNGSAIIKVAEGDWRVTYSWREWDLYGNKELRIIKVCDSPFDSLADTEYTA